MVRKIRSGFAGERTPWWMTEVKLISALRKNPKTKACVTIINRRPNDVVLEILLSDLFDPIRPDPKIN